MSQNITAQYNELGYWKTKCFELEGKLNEMGDLENKLYALVQEIERLSTIVQEYEKSNSNNSSQHNPDFHRILAEERTKSNQMLDNIKKLELEKFRLTEILSTNEKDILLMRSELFKMKQTTQNDNRVSKLMQENQKLAEMLQSQIKGSQMIQANQSRVFSECGVKDNESLMQTISKLSKENQELKQSKQDIEKKAVMAIREMEEMQNLLKEQAKQIENVNFD